MKAYLFDWGDTLMVDDPTQKGKMCDWPEVKAVDGAEPLLSYLSESAPVYIATNAADSTEEDIKKAFERVNLAQFVSGYFCKANLGIGKGSPAFYLRICQQLNCNPAEVTMIGDSLDNDVKPAVSAGLQAIWFNVNKSNAGDYEQAVSLVAVKQRLANT